jgi:hypothetical protein
MPRVSDYSCFSGTTSWSENSVSTHGIDLDSLRKKLQRTTIESIGVQGVELWWAAFKLQKNARGFLRPFEPNVGTDLCRASIGSKITDEDKTSLHFNQQPAPTNVLTTVHLTQPASEFDALPDVYKRQWEWIPPDTQRLLLTPYRVKKNTWGLSDELCRRILAGASGACKILTYRQQLSVLKHARSKLTLTREMDAYGKGATYQKLKMLEAMGCLTYPMRTSGDYEYS